MRRAQHVSNLCRRVLSHLCSGWTAAIAILVTGCSPLALINLTVSDSSFTAATDIAYGKDPRQKLDVYRPISTKTLSPVVVFFYGGSWRNGERSQYKFVGEALAARGIVAIVPDYRVYPQVTYPGFVEDSAAAVAWALREAARYGGDPKRVFVMGHSAGAYNAAMVAIDPRWLNAYGIATSSLAGFIGIAGPYNFLPIVDEDVKPAFDWPNTSADTQPITHVTSEAPPALLLAANGDKIVNPERNTEGLASALRQKDVPVQVKRYDGVNHFTIIGSMAWPLRWLAPVLDDVVDFVERGNSNKKL